MIRYGNLKVEQQPWTGGSVMDLNNLTRLNAIRPEVAEGFTAQLYSAITQKQSMLLNKVFGNPKVIEAKELEWKVKGAKKIPDTLVANADPNEAIKGRAFELEFSRDLWKYGDEISPGDQTHKFQSRIVSNPYRKGNHFVYKVELSHADSIPSQYLEAGAQWSKLFSSYGEAANQGGSTQLSGNFSMKTKVGKLRKEFQITDYAWQHILNMTVTDSEGKEHKYIEPYVMREVRSQWYDEIEKALVWQRTTDYELDSTGNRVDKFPGLIEQIEEYGITWETNGVTLRSLEDFIYYLVYNKVSADTTKVIEFYTGRVGMANFSRMIEGGIGNRNGWVLQNDSNFAPVRRMSSPYHTNAFSYGYQFLEYRHPANIIVRPIVLDALDDTSSFFEKDNGLPKSSQQMIFLDVSGVGGESENIQILTPKNGYREWTVDGGFSIMGPSNNGKGAHTGDYSTYCITKEMGVWIKDPSRIGMISIA